MRLIVFSCLYPMLLEACERFTGRFDHCQGRKPCISTWGIRRKVFCWYSLQSQVATWELASRGLSVRSFCLYCL